MKQTIISHDSTTFQTKYKELVSQGWETVPGTVVDIPGMLSLVMEKLEPVPVPIKPVPQIKTTPK